MESKVRLSKVNEEGVAVKFNDVYVVNSQSFTECESKVTASLEGCEHDILTEAFAKYREIFFSDNEEDMYYRVKVDFITVDDSGKTRHAKSDYLVQAGSVEDVKKSVDEVLGNGVSEYRIISIQESNVTEYIC